MVSQNSIIEQLGIRSCIGRSKEDGGSMYCERRKELFLVSSEVFQDYIDFADFKACDAKAWWVGELRY